MERENVPVNYHLQVQIATAEHPDLCQYLQIHMRTGY